MLLLLNKSESQRLGTCCLPQLVGGKTLLRERADTLPRKTLGGRLLFHTMEEATLDMVRGGACLSLFPASKRETLVVRERADILARRTLVGRLPYHTAEEEVRQWESLPRPSTKSETGYKPSERGLVTCLLWEKADVLPRRTLTKMGGDNMFLMEERLGRADMLLLSKGASPLRYSSRP